MALSKDTHERFFLEGNFTMWQPCMTECQGSEGGAAVAALGGFPLLPNMWPNFIMIWDALIPKAVSVVIQGLHNLIYGNKFLFHFLSVCAKKNL